MANWPTHRDNMKLVLKTFEEEEDHDDGRADTDFWLPVKPLESSADFRMQLRSLFFRMTIAFQIYWFLERLNTPDGKLATHKEAPLLKKSSEIQKEFRDLQRRAEKFLEKHSTRKKWSTRCSEKERMFSWWKKQGQVWEWEKPWNEAGIHGDPQEEVQF